MTEAIIVAVIMFACMAMLIYALLIRPHNVR